MAASPVLAVAGFVMGKIMASFTSQETGAYAKAGESGEGSILCLRNKNVACVMTEASDR